MANKYRNEVEVELNGTKYLLRPTFDAIAKIEDHTGQSIFKLLASIMTLEVKAKDIAFILEAGMAAAGSKVDEEALRKNMSEGGFNDCLTAVCTFLTAAVQSGENVKKN